MDFTGNTLEEKAQAMGDRFWHAQLLRGAKEISPDELGRRKSEETLTSVF